MANTTRTRKPVKRYAVTRVELANERTGETFVIPGMLCTVAEIQAMVECAPYTVQVWCETCGESVAECWELRGKLCNIPAEWSTWTVAE